MHVFSGYCSVKKPQISYRKQNTVKHIYIHKARICLNVTIPHGTRVRSDIEKIFVGQQVRRE